MPKPRLGRLRRSDCSAPGLRRIGRGRGFSYVRESGEPVRDPEMLERVRELAIPPAWREVWICLDPLGHLQATGIDAAGRKQYLYHPRWREHRDRLKFDRMLSFAAGLPRLRGRVANRLSASTEFDETRVLACALRLLDIGMFRIGSEQYADQEGGIGLATVLKEHVSLRDGVLQFDYPAKSGVRRLQTIHDPVLVEIVGALRRRRGGSSQLLAFRRGRRWYDVRSEDINGLLKRELGEEYSAKDFRTWNATVMAAIALGTDGRDAQSKTARKRAMDRSVRAVAELLGNTPAVARRAYIDPRVFDRYRSGWTIAAAIERLGDLDPSNDRVRARLERAVIDLLEERAQSRALERNLEAA